MAEIRCSNPRCNKIIGEGFATVREVPAEKKADNGKVVLKCKCGTFNEVDARVDKPYIQNQPYQNRIGRVLK